MGPGLLVDEHFPVQIVYRLRRLGYDVVTVRERCASKYGDGIPDEDVLAMAAEDRRTVLTANRRHFVALHEKSPDHSGIIVCTLVEHEDPKVCARRLDTLIKAHRGELENKLLRLGLPSTRKRRRGPSGG